MTDKPYRIIIADDHLVVREAIRVMLEMEPEFEVVGEASDGKQALELAAQLGPDLVLMDIWKEIWSKDSEPCYSFMNPNEEAIQSLFREGWRPEKQVRSIEMWRYPDPEGVMTATSKPAILVIGKQETGSYTTLFRLANDGLIPYEEALLVDGCPTLDGYDLTTLRPYSALFLYGYDYSDSAAA